MKANQGWKTLSPSPDEIVLALLPIPATTQLVRMAGAPGWWLARAAVELEAMDGLGRYWFAGAHASSDPLFSKRLARCEMLERLLAMPELHRERLRDGVGFITWRFLDGVIKDPVSGSRVLLWGKEDMTGRARVTDGPMATGLAFHKGSTQAAHHAVCELLERHLACLLWFAKELALAEWGRPSRNMAGVTLRRFTFQRDPLIPFVMTVADHGCRDIFAVGTSLHEDMAKAASSADREALMTLENVLVRTDGPANKFDSRERLKTLVGEGASERWRFVEQRVQASRFEVPRTSLPELCKCILAQPEQLTITKIWEATGAVLVRAMSPEVLHKRDQRLAHAQRQVPPHPFC